MAIFEGVVASNFGNLKVCMLMRDGKCRVARNRPSELEFKPTSVNRLRVTGRHAYPFRAFGELRFPWAPFRPLRDSDTRSTLKQIC